MTTVNIYQSYVPQLSTYAFSPNSRRPRVRKSIYQKECMDKVISMYPQLKLILVDSFHGHCNIYKVSRTFLEMTKIIEQVEKFGPAQAALPKFQ